MHTSKLLGNRRKTYILDVICNRFYFGEVQEKVLGQCSRQGISAPRTESLSVYQQSVPEKKQAGCLRKCLCKYSFEVSGFVLEILEKSKVITSVNPQKCVTLLENTKPKKGLLNYVAFFFFFLITHKLSNSLEEIPHAITSIRSHFHIFKPIFWLFYRNSLIQKKVQAMSSSV